MKIPITDPRIVALGDLSAPLVIGGQPAPSIPADAAPPSGFAARRDGDTAYFANVHANNGAEIGVQIVDDVLIFLPDRSSQHKAILRQLGESV